MRQASLCTTCAVGLLIPSIVCQAGPVATTAPPATTPSGSAASEMPPRTKMALKLAGLVTFVANSCPQLKTDYARFKASLGTLGLSVEDLAKDGVKGTYLGYAAQYQRDVKGSCERARLQFGPKGATIPDLFGVR